MFEMIQKGGAIMYPIILCSIIAFAVILERVYYFRKIKIDTVGFMSNIESALKHNKVAESVKICEVTPGAIAAVVKAGIVIYERHWKDIS
jgi:biopolymer transport protein ExbB